MPRYLDSRKIVEASIFDAPALALILGVKSQLTHSPADRPALPLRTALFRRTQVDAEPVVVRPTYMPRQVADFLRASIDRGDHPPGTILPAERILTEKYGVSLTVV